MKHLVEFDADKSESNKEKHGIDFIEIPALWDDPDRVEVPARTEEEARYLLVGKVEESIWSVIVTYREDKIRIISARRSREKEKELYES